MFNIKSYSNLIVIKTQISPNINDIAEIVFSVQINIKLNKT